MKYIHIRSSTKWKLRKTHVFSHVVNYTGSNAKLVYIQLITFKNFVFGTCPIPAGQ